MRLQNLAPPVTGSARFFSSLHPRCARLLTMYIFIQSSPTLGANKNKPSYDGFFLLAPRVGLEPTTYRLTAERSTD